MTCATGAALAALLAAAAPTAKPPAMATATLAGCYDVTSPIEIPSNVDVEPSGAVTINGTAIFTITNEANVKIGALTIQGSGAVIFQPISISGSHGVQITGTQLVSPSGAVYVLNSYNVYVENINSANGLYHGVYFNGVYNSAVTGSTLQNEVGFGIILAGVNHDNLIQGNTTTKNGLELVGIESGGYNNRIIRNYSQGTGDNCFSITGYSNVISDNAGIGCAGNGIDLYGSWNVATNNYLLNNAQKGATNTNWKAGIAVGPAYGGLGLNNTLSGNETNDTQTVTTQEYGVLLQPGANNTEVSPNTYLRSGVSSTLDASGMTGNHFANGYMQ